MRHENNIKQGTKLLKPKIDVVFKLLFGDKRNLELLESLLKSVLSIPEDEYETLTLQDTHLKKEYMDDKLSIVDVRLTTKSKKIIHIEIQILELPEMPERITYYNSKIAVTQLKAGQRYDELQKTISIAIVDYNMIKDSQDYHHIFQLRDKETGVLFTDLIEIHTLELRKLPEHTDNTPKYSWLRFIRAEKEDEFMEATKENPMIEKAFDELKRLSSDEQAQRMADDREKALRDEYARNRHAFSQGITQGIAQGITQGITQVALKMKEDGNMSYEEIARLTGLSIADIEKL